MRPVRPLLALACTILLPVMARGQVSYNLDSSRTVITASGSARATSAPDRATLTVFVEPQAMSVEEAANRLASVERAVLDTLRRFNLPASSVQTMNSGVSPYRSPMSPSAGPSFAGRSTIRIELTRLDLIPAITGAALAKGASFAAPTNYSSSVSDSSRRALVPQAFQQARREAEALAMAAGGHLGRLLDLTTSPAPMNYSDQVQSVIMTGMMYDNGQRVSPIANTVVTVTARWLLVRDTP